MNAPASFVTTCAISIPIWWIALFQSPSTRRMFVSDEGWSAFANLMLPDLLLAIATAMFAWRLWQNRATPLLAGVVLGGWAYGTVLAIVWSRDASLWLGAVLMLAATIGIAVICHVRFSSRAARSGCA